MPTDALFQLGIVSGVLNISQEEESFLRRPRRRAPACLRGAPVRKAARRASIPSWERLHPMQDQVSRSRTPA
ncbi:MAG: hypothetical protein AMXMBFR66_29130 [Pseudomonadota bacterium]